MSTGKRFLNLGNLWPGVTSPFAIDYSTPAWGSYFADHRILDPLMPYFDVMGFPWLQSTGNFGGFPNSPTAANGFRLDTTGMWKNLFAILKQHNKDVTVAVGYIYNNVNGAGGNALGGTARAQNDAAIISEMMALGSPLPIITMDGFPVLMAYQTTAVGGLTQVYSATDWNGELVNYVTYLRSQFPGIRIGLDVNYASWGAFGNPGYLGPNGSAPTGNTTVGLYNYNYNYAALSNYPAVLWNTSPPLGIVQGLANAGLGAFEFLQTDFPYDYMMGFASHGSWTNGYSVNWLKQHLLLETFVQGNVGIPFGLMLHSSVAGANGPNSRYYYEALDQLAQFIAAGGNPDQVVVEEFYQHIDALLPVTQYNPFSFTLGSLARAAAVGDPTYTPAFLLYDAASNPNYLIVDTMSNRNFFLGGQPNTAVAYADQGILFWEPGGQLQWQALPGLTLDERITLSTSTIITPNQAFAQGLVNAGWTPQASTSYSSLLAAPNPPTPPLVH